MTRRISEIRIHPVKSLGGFICESAKAEGKGFRLDRRWMVIDRNGRFVSQREQPKMATLRVEPYEDGCVIRDGGEVLHLGGDKGGHVRDVTVWGDQCEAIDLGEEAAAWVSKALGGEFRIVRMPDRDVRPVDPRFGRNGEAVSFADAFPYLVIGQASLDELNARLPDPIGMERFRPNFVVSGTEPFEEDTWTKIRIGSAVFRVAKPCARCVVTTIDQQRGMSSGKEPLRTLAKFRRAEQVLAESFGDLGLGKNDVLFGQNLVKESGDATIRTGDVVEVTESAG